MNQWHLDQPQYQCSNVKIGDAEKREYESQTCDLPKDCVVKREKAAEPAGRESVDAKHECGGEGRRLCKDDNLSNRGQLCCLAESYSLSFLNSEAGASKTFALGMGLCIDDSVYPSRPLQSSTRLLLYQSRSLWQIVSVTELSGVLDESSMLNE